MLGLLYVIGAIPAFFIFIIIEQRIEAMHPYKDYSILTLLILYWPIGIPILFLYERALTKAFIPKIPTATIYKHV